MAAIDSIYNYYLSNYGTNNVSRYDTHKKSELRSIWNNMVKVNKESPLYKLKEKQSAVQKFVIDIKESARAINNVVASLSTDGKSIEDSFQKKIATSSDPDVISAKYIGEDNGAGQADDFKVQVQQLAKPQVNIGNLLPANTLSIASGDYVFDLDYLSNKYEFQFHVDDSDTNYSIQNRLANLISNSNIGLEASLISDHNGSNALRIESTQTGLAYGESEIFSIHGSLGSPSLDFIDTLGLTRITQNAQNSKFMLNGVEKSSLSNTFTINKTFEVTLNGTNADDDETVIGFKPNIDAVADNVQELVDSYNQALNMAYTKSTSPEATNRLIRDLTSTTKTYRNDLEAVGLVTQSDGSIKVDKNLLSEALTDDNAKDELFSALSKFKDSLSSKAKSVSLNPMKYVNKVVVAYKNPGHNFATPYISSVYSGMMLDRYC